MRKLTWPLVLLSLFGLTACEKTTEETVKKTHYDQNYLLIAHHENLINYNLDDQKIQWQYQSRFDKNSSNGNLFTVDDHRVYMPYESGVINAFDIISGDALWQQEVEFECNGGPFARSSADDAMDEFRPLLMSQATIYDGRLYIPSTGEAQSCLYVYDINTGEQLANPELPTRYNIYAPVVNQYGAFSNGAIYLSSFSSNPENILTKGQLTFDTPIYSPLYAAGDWLYVTSEKNEITAIDVSDTNNTGNLPIKWQKNYLTDQENSIAPRVILADKMLYMIADKIQYIPQADDSRTWQYDLILRAIDLKSGEVNWTQLIENVFASTPKDFQVGNHYFVISNAQTVAFVDKTTRQIAAKFTVGDSIPEIESNIVEKDDNTFIYLSKQNLIELDVAKQTVQSIELNNLTLSKPHDSYDHFQIQLLAK